MKRAEACRLLNLSEHEDGLFGKTTITKAYRDAALIHHPDRGGSNENFQRVHEARDLLLEELDRGRRTVDDECVKAADSSDVQEPSPVNNSWQGAKYNRPSTESPLSCLRQMGKALDLTTIPPDEMTQLWLTRNVQCVWMCKKCDAVCCRVRRDKFKCVCGHQLKYHDPSAGFKCTCQAIKRGQGMEQPVHKGSCPCPRFSFLVSHGMWQVKCKCHHDHEAHDPATGCCRRCECMGWWPTWQCHCGHGCETHTTEFIRGYLGEGHRDWVVSGVRLECARLAEKFRARPLQEQIRRRMAAGLSQENLFTCADIWQQERHRKARKKRREDMRRQWKQQQQQQQQEEDKEEEEDREQNDHHGADMSMELKTEEKTLEGPKRQPMEAEPLLPNGVDGENLENVANNSHFLPSEASKDEAHSQNDIISDKIDESRRSLNFFERHQLDIKERAQRKKELEKQIHIERQAHTSFQPKTNHKSSWRRRNYPNSGVLSSEVDDKSEPGKESTSPPRCSSSGSRYGTLSPASGVQRQEEDELMLKNEEQNRPPLAAVKPPKQPKCLRRSGEITTMERTKSPPRSSISISSYAELVKHVTTKKKKRPPKPTQLQKKKSDATVSEVAEKDGTGIEGPLHPNSAAARSDSPSSAGDRAINVKIWLRMTGLEALIPHLVDVAGAESVDDLRLLDEDDFNDLGVEDKRMRKTLIHALENNDFAKKSPAAASF